MNSQDKPICYIIAGPNGAGKTTFALTYLAEFASCRHFINADLIAAGLSPLNPEIALPEAGRIYRSHIKAFVRRSETFAIETTLSGRMLLPWIDQLKAAGKKIILIYLWVPSAAFSEARVLEQVIHGGPDISDDILFRRYPKSLKHFARDYAPKCDEIICFDNSSPFPTPIFSKDAFGLSIKNKELYGRIFDDVPKNPPPAQNRACAESAHRALRTAVKDAIIHMKHLEQDIILSKGGEPYRVPAAQLIKSQ